MQNSLKVFGVILLIVLGLGIIGFVVNGIETGNYAFWAPKQEAVRTQVFKNTQAYIDGKVTQLSDYKLQYDTSKDVQDKKIIENTVRDQFGSFDATQLNDHPVLQQWLITIRGN